MKTLQQIQQEIGRWARQQFGDNVSKDTRAAHHDQLLWEIPSLYGMIGELGELAQLDLRAMQGRSKLTAPDDIHEARGDALADCLVYMCDYSYRQDIDLNEVLDRVWDKVQKRRLATWEADKAKEGLPGAIEAARGGPAPQGPAPDPLGLRAPESARKDATGNFGAGCGEGHHEWEYPYVGGKLRQRCKLCKYEE